MEESASDLKYPSVKHIHDKKLNKVIYIDTEGTLRPQRIIENCAVQTLTSKRDSRKYHTILGLQNVSIDLTNIKSVNSQITHSEFKKSQFTYPPQAFDTFIKIAQNNNIFRLSERY